MHVCILARPQSPCDQPNFLRHVGIEGLVLMHGRHRNTDMIAMLSVVGGMDAPALLGIAFVAIHATPDVEETHK